MKKYTHEDFIRLRKAVRRLYNAAWWHPDRPLRHEDKYWDDVRDAAGFEAGASNARLGGDRSR